MDSGLDPEAYAPGVAAREALADLAASWLEGTSEEGVVAYFREALREVSVDPDVAASSLRVLFHSGFESSARFTGLAVFHLLRLGLARELEAGGYDGLRELGRFDTPVQAESRSCVVETVLDGETIRRGETVVVLLGSANRDPGVFDAPDEVDFRRPPNLSITFGRGVHSCPGRDFALTQGRGMVRALIETYPEAGLAKDPVYKRHATLRGLASLPLRFGPETR
jgi:cytochrome P450